MELTTPQQTTAFLWAFLLGAVLEAVYFLIAVSREAFQAGKIQIFIGDILFSLFSVILNSLYAIAMTEGKIRFYVIFAELLVFLPIYFVLGRTIKCKLGASVKRADETIRRFFL